MVRHSGEDGAGHSGICAGSGARTDNLRRPLQFLWQRPIIQVIDLVMTLNFGIYCLLLSTLATVCSDHFGQSEVISSLHYIAVPAGTNYYCCQDGSSFHGPGLRKIKSHGPKWQSHPRYPRPVSHPGNHYDPHRPLLPWLGGRGGHALGHGRCWRGSLRVRYLLARLGHARLPTR